MLTDALAAIDWAINYLNTHPVESREYGKWIPRDRWEADLAAHPMRQVDADFSWLQAPAIVKRKVVRGMLRATVPGPSGGAATLDLQRAVALDRRRKGTHAPL